MKTKKREGENIRKTKKEEDYKEGHYSIYKSALGLQVGTRFASREYLKLREVFYYEIGVQVFNKGTRPVFNKCTYTFFSSNNAALDVAKVAPKTAFF